MSSLLIVADHSLIIETIRLALRNTAGFRILGYVDGGRPLGPEVVEASPDVVIVDDMRERSRALARIGEAHELVPTAKILLLTIDMSAGWLDEAVEAGAEGVISKAVHPVSLGTLVRETANGNIVHVTGSARARRETPPVDCPLTTRELEILRLVAQGGSNSSIARELWVTEQTVKFHLSNIYRKLGVANRTEASHYAHTMRLLDQPVLREVG